MPQQCVSGDWLLRWNETPESGGTGPGSTTESSKSEHDIEYAFDFMAAWIPPDVRPVNPDRAVLIAAEGRWWFGRLIRWERKGGGPGGSN
jgi:hypothetical protein